MRYILVSLTAIALLTACKEPPQVPHYAPPSYSQLGPITLDVGSVDVQDEYQSPRNAPHVEHLFSTPPADALKIWVRDRIRTTNSANRLAIIIQDASVKETKLPLKKGFAGAFEHEPAFRYDATLVLEMRIYAGGRMSDAQLRVSVNRSDMLIENASVNDRQQLYKNMTDALMKSANAEIEQQMRQHFGRWLR